MGLGPPLCSLCYRDPDYCQGMGCNGPVIYLLEMTDDQCREMDIAIGTAIMADREASRRARTRIDPAVYPPLPPLPDVGDNPRT